MKATLLNGSLKDIHADFDKRLVLLRRNLVNSKNIDKVDAYANRFDKPYL